MTDLKAHWLELSKVAANIKPVSIRGDADRCDVENVIADLEIIKREFVKLITAYGDYAHENLNADPDTFAEAATGMADWMDSPLSELADVAERIEEEMREAV